MARTLLSLCLLMSSHLTMLGYQHAHCLQQSQTSFLWNVCHRWFRVTSFPADVIQNGSWDLMKSPDISSVHSECCGVASIMVLLWIDKIAHVFIGHTYLAANVMESLILIGICVNLIPIYFFWSYVQLRNEILLISSIHYVTKWNGQTQYCLGTTDTGVKQCTFRCLISNDIAQKLMVLKSLIIHHFIVITCISYAIISTISLPKLINIAPL